MDSNEQYIYFSDEFNDVYCCIINEVLYINANYKSPVDITILVS